MSSGCAYCVGQQVDGGPGRRRGAGPVRPVDPHHGVEVNRAALLELGNLAVREPNRFLQLHLRESGAGGNLPSEASGEPHPEVAGVVVEQDRSGVVVRLGVQGGTELGCVCRVPTTATASATFGTVVDRAEGRSGKGGEDPGDPHGGGDVAAIVSGQARADQVVGVSAYVQAQEGQREARRFPQARRSRPPGSSRSSSGRGSRRWSCPWRGSIRSGGSGRSSHRYGGSGPPSGGLAEATLSRSPRVSRSSRSSCDSGMCTPPAAGGAVGHDGASFRICGSGRSTASGRRMLGGIEAARKPVSGGSATPRASGRPGR